MLGLTVAEIFILLIFLILLALLGLASNWEEKEEEYRADTRILSVWRDIIDEFKAPEEIATLHSKTTRLEQKFKELHEENVELSNRISTLQEDRRTAREQLAEAQQVKDEENAVLREEVRTLRREREDLRRENTRLSNRNSALRQQAMDERREADRIRTDLDTLQRKGENPPCWYETVPDGDGTREKPHYIFNIGVHDEYMVVRRHPIPPGRAHDDNGRPYSEEAVDLLRLEDIPYDTRLSYGEMTRTMKRIRDLGKMRKVRSYSCIFWVKVWDKTSPDAKARWKDAHDGVLEGLFGTYLVKDDPWPESP